MPGGSPGKLKACAAAFYRRSQPAGAGNAFAQVLAQAAEKQVTEIWPENWTAWRLFMQMDTQWRHGFNGRTGLCYEAMYPLMDRMGLDAAEWDRLLNDVGVLERAGLEAMYS